MLAFQLALVLPVPAILFAIGLLLVIANDPPRSDPAAVTALLKVTWPSWIIVVLALSIVLAIWSSGEAVRPAFPGASESPGRSSCSSSSPGLRGPSAIRRWPIRQPCLNCHVASPRPCGVRGARNAFRILP